MGSAFAFSSFFVSSVVIAGVFDPSPIYLKLAIAVVNMSSYL
jgi:hypothetical protein